MTDDAPVVIVDSREPDYYGDQLQSYGLVVVKDTLPAGDYVFYPHGLKVAIERKRVDDLMNSLSDNRMVSQAHKLIDGADAAILLREGDYRRTPAGVVAIETKQGWRETGWSWDSFQGMMLDLKWMGLMFHECALGDAPREIARVVGSLSKQEHAWIRSRERPQVISISKQYRDAIWSLAAWRGIGVETAEAMLRHFGSIRAVYAANPEALSLCTVGKTTLRHLGQKLATQLDKEWSALWTATS